MSIAWANLLLDKRDEFLPPPTTFDGGRSTWTLNTVEVGDTALEA